MELPNLNKKKNLTWRPYFILLF